MATTAGELNEKVSGMTFRNRILQAAAATLLLAPSLSLQARLVDIEYYDRAGPAFPGSGGPLWTGVVDTVANTLTVETWTELPGHGSEWWTPADLPMIWNAVDGSGNIYDVPDDFGDEGVVDFGDDASPADDFAFVSPISSQQMNWYAFDSGTGQVDTSQTVSFNGAIPIYIGWGGVGTLVDPEGEIVYDVAQPNPQSSSTEYDYRVVPLLPISDTSIQTSTNATITVLPPQGASVPEASAFLCVGAAALAYAARRRREASRV